MIVLFGAGGQLATELAAMAAAEEVPIASFTEAEADITDPEAVRRAIRTAGPTVAVNAAAYNSVDRAETEFELAIRVNAHGPAVLADACAAVDVPLIHISTDYVFDGEKQGPYREDDPVAPLGAYGFSKARGEEAVRTVCPDHVIIRTAWLYGVHGSNFLKTMLRLAGERDELNVVADQHGSPTSTVDLARAVLTVASAIGLGRRVWGTYHFAGTGMTTWHGFASRIVAAQARVTGRAPRVNAIATADFPTAARRPRNSVLDSGKFARTFGYRATDWQIAVDRTVSELLAGRAAA